jgi:hypothetical protein
MGVAPTQPDHTNERFSTPNAGLGIAHPRVNSTVWKPTAVALSLPMAHLRRCLSRYAERDSGLRPYIGFQTVLEPHRRCKHLMLATCGHVLPRQIER